jgi:hypothetical protein
MTKSPRAGPAGPAHFSHGSAGRGQAFAHAVHIADTILSSDRKQITVGFTVQATILLSWLGDASDRATR